MAEEGRRRSWEEEIGEGEGEEIFLMKEGGKEQECICGSITPSLPSGGAEPGGAGEGGEGEAEAEGAGAEEEGGSGTLSSPPLHFPTTLLSPLTF